MPPSTTRSRRRCGQPVPLSTGLSTGSCPRPSTAVSGPSEAPTQVGRKTSGRALTGWTAGAHVPAVQLSSLPLDEWHYMRINEMVCVRLRPARRHACRRAAKRPGRSWTSSTVDIPVGSLSPVLSPRTWLPQPLQPAEPALGAGQPAQDRPVGMTHRICKAKLPSCSLGRSSAPSPATRAGYASPARLTHSTSRPVRGRRHWLPPPRDES